MVQSSTQLRCKRFDYEKMYISTGGRADFMLSYFKSVNDSKGINFIVNPDIVIKNPQNCTERQLAEYLGLCSLRNLGDFLISGTVDLYDSQIPNWIPKQVYENHPLIKYNPKLRLLEFLFEKENK